MLQTQSDPYISLEKNRLGGENRHYAPKIQLFVHSKDRQQKLGAHEQYVDLSGKF